MGAGLLTSPAIGDLVYLTKPIIVRGTYYNTHIRIIILRTTNRCASYFNRIILGKQARHVSIGMRKR